MNTKRLTKLLALALAVVMSLAVLTACPKPAPEGAGRYTYQTYTTLSPSNWNELTYQDNNDTQIMGYIGSSFFTFDFKFDENGEIVPGDFEVEYSAATKLEDVSAKYLPEWFGVPAEVAEKYAGSGYAYAITLRDDLKWENGDPIKAEDFVYTMKEQLNPLFKNYRADSFYVGSTIIYNAMYYAKQGEELALADLGEYAVYTMADFVKGEDGVYTQPNGEPVFFALTEDLAYLGGSVTDYKKYLDADAYAALMKLADDDGRVAITDETIELMSKLIYTEDWGYETPDYLPNYVMAANFVFPEMDFSEVGIFVGENEYEIVIVLENPLDLLKEDGSLGYKAAYNMSSLPLVHKATYEACKVAPSGANDLWTSTYNSSLETTMSWGAYKLTEFQSGKYYLVERNDNWYGYNMPENEGLYQTDRVYCETIGEWNTAWLKFQAGEIEGIGIDVSIADEYKNSDRAYFTPDDFVGSMQLQSSAESLKSRGDAEGVNKMLMAYTDFRQALSLAINRADYANKCTTASLQGFGIYTTVHYYDVANGGAYRHTDEAKQVICDIYSVNVNDYASLDDAYAAVTGYNVAEARKLVDKAYDAAVAAGDIKDTDKIKFEFGTGAITESTQRQYDYITAAWQEMFKGTKIEGRVEFELSDKQTSWANDFRAGGYDICMGGWTGAAWDPGYFLLAYLSPSYMYSAAWDTSKAMMTFTMKGVAEDGGDITATMSLMDWYKCLNGKGTYDWSSNALEESQRLQLIAALEREVLKVYYTVPLTYSFGASLLSHKVDYITYEYNTFMSYGGMKYMTYNYDDAEWAAYVAENNGQLNYK